MARFLSFTLSIFVMLVLAAPAHAASKATWNVCNGNDDKAAVKACTQIIDDISESRKNRGTAYYNRGISNSNLGRRDAAIADYTKAIELRPRFKSAYNNRGNAYNDKKDHQSALADLTKAIELDPNYGRAYNNRGIAHRNLGRHDLAIADYNRAIAINGRDADAYNNRGYAYLDMKEYANARRDLRKALELNPNHGKAKANLKLLAKREGTPTPGNDNSGTRVVNNDVDDLTSDTGLGGGLGLGNDNTPTTNSGGNGEPSKADWDGCAGNDDRLAIQACTRVIAVNPKRSDLATAHNNRGVSYFRTNQNDLAIADYTRAIELNPDYANAHSNRCNALRIKKQYDRAVRDCNRAIEINPNHENAHYNRALLHSNQQNYQAAVRDYTRTIAINGRSANAYNNRCYAYRHMDEYKKAIADCTKSIEINGNDADPYFNRAISQSYLKNRSQAIADYSAALRIDPKYEAAYNNRCDLYRQDGQLEAAIADCTSAINLNNNYAHAFNNRGVAYMDQKRFDLARADLKRALEIDPNHPNAGANLRLLNKKAGGSDVALSNNNSSSNNSGDFEKVDKAIWDRCVGNDDNQAIKNCGIIIESREKPKNRAIAHNNRAVSYGRQGQQDRALADYTRAIELDPDYFDAIHNRGILYTNTGKPRLAIADYERAIAIKSDHADAHYNLGIPLAEVGELDKAIASYTRALNLNTRYVNAYFNRGLAYEKKGQNRQAVSDFTQVIRLEPRDADAYYNRGVSYGNLKQYRDAVVDYTKAIEINPRYVNAYNNRADAYINLGDYITARPDVERALQLDPNHKEAKVNLNILDKEEKKQRDKFQGTALLPQPLNKPDDASSSDNVVTSFSSGSPAALSEKRVALIIGNSAYSAVPSLENPKRDATAMAEMFRKLGFSHVTHLNDVTKSKLQRALIDFADKAQGADWAVVYYAGHGMEMNGTNYLIPVDAQLKRDRHVELETVSLDQVMVAADGAKKFRLVILDACRNNPFVAQMKSSSSTRSIGRGLARVEPAGGSLVAYAARHGQVAQDGDGSNSPYVKALLRHIQEPGLDVRLMLAKVRDSVIEATNNAQQPFTYGSLPGQTLSFRPQ